MTKPGPQGEGEKGYIMKKVNSVSMVARWLAYVQSSMDNITAAYKNPSYRKVCAWQTCKAICNEHAGSGLRVCMHTSQFFTAGFTACIDGVDSFVYITANNTYYCPLAELC